MRVAMSLKQFQIHPSITLVERTKGGVCVCGFCPFLNSPLRYYLRRIEHWNYNACHPCQLFVSTKLHYLWWGFFLEDTSFKHFPEVKKPWQQLSICVLTIV